MSEENLESRQANKWYQKMWRPAAAGIYFLIVVFDFVIMPAVIGNQSPNIAEVATIVNELENPEAQVVLINEAISGSNWEPLTLGAGGIFHIAFGALLTGSSITRGLEKREIARRGKT